MIAPLLRKLLTAEAIGVALFIISLQVLTYGVSASLPNTDTHNFFWICLAAAAISFLMGRYRWGWIQASLGIITSGLLFVWILGARLTLPLLDLGKAAMFTIPKIVPAIQSKEPLETTLISGAWAVIADSSSALLTRLHAWSFGLNKTVTVNDSLIRNMAWVLILWICAAWMGWFARKRNALASLLPAIFLMAAVTSYSEYKIDSLWLMIILLLVLMGVWNYKNHTQQGESSRIDYSDSIRFDSGQAVLFLTLTVGFFAIITPSISWQDVVDYIQERRSSEAAEMLGIKEPAAPGKPAATQQPSLPREHLLSGGIANSENIVMTIKTGELPPLVDEPFALDAPRYYWRSTIYDQYVGSGWITSIVFQQKISADTPLIPGLLKGYRVVHLDVQLHEPEGALFWSGSLFSTDIPFTAIWRVKPTSDLFADQSALLQTDIFAAVSNATSYQADVYIPTPTITELRAASTEYPEEILKNYLSLPRTLPEPVRELAREITTGIPNPYDKAKAIESYLRTNYPYDLDVPQPPEGRDVAEYFLFDLKKGYCDYYATTMVVLARSVGIPARFVSGYSPGTYEASTAQYIIRELNAHSWAEIYFPGIGWVEFEPTASLPEIERTNETAVPSENQTNEETASALLARFRLERILIWLSPLMVILISMLIFFVFIERWSYLRLSPEIALDQIYQNFYRAGRPLAGEWNHAETSTEYMHKISNKLSIIKIDSRFVNICDRLINDANRLTRIYHLALFIEHKIDKSDVRTAWSIWIRLRRRLYLIRFLLFVRGNRIISEKVLIYDQS